MDREYNQNLSKNLIPIMFVGKEVEHTQFKDQDTLFIVGHVSKYRILEQISRAKELYDIDITHIYLAANHTMNELVENLHIDSKYFKNSIYDLIMEGFNVTLESTPELLTEDVYSQLPFGNNHFCLMISVPIPKVLSKHSNIIIKIDDSDFNRKNPGVWCKELSETVFDSSCLTTWDQYKGDIVLAAKEHNGITMNIDRKGNISY